MFIEQDGKCFRMRRGKLVEIPRKWLHRIPTTTTKSDRRKAAKAKRKTYHQRYQHLRRLPIEDQ